ncbi:hypothetical protein [Streptomyces cavernicola]|uniref:DUF2637 domain-containing protein n=1 Tax=Streptomyces cavernicola TaxID=3043613 RepID=A0ABT6S694_9ACTN|nr:hypothetical protein [Streptomyces sp. B-S-A6]MDI3403434.1 hypothetical protein [Streptomyces sp. B-S-A6]
MARRDRGRVQRGAAGASLLTFLPIPLVLPESKWFMVGIAAGLFPLLLPFLLFGAAMLRGCLLAGGLDKSESRRDVLAVPGTLFAGAAVLTLIAGEARREQAATAALPGPAQPGGGEGPETDWSHKGPIGARRR